MACYDWTKKSLLRHISGNSDRIVKFDVLDSGEFYVHQSFYGICGRHPFILQLVIDQQRIHAIRSVAQFYCSFVVPFEFSLSRYNVGAQLATFSVLSGEQCTKTNYADTKSYQRINSNSKSCAFSPFKGFAIVFGTTFLGGFIFFAKGIYRSNDVLIRGGWSAAAIGLVGLLLITLGHLFVLC